MVKLKVGDRVRVNTLQCLGRIVAQTTTGPVPEGVAGMEHHELFGGWFRVQLDRAAILDGMEVTSDVFMPGELRAA